MQLVNEEVHKLVMMSSSNLLLKEAIKVSIYPRVSMSALLYSFQMARSNRLTSLMILRYKINSNPSRTEKVKTKKSL